MNNQTKSALFVFVVSALIMGAFILGLAIKTEYDQPIEIVRFGKIVDGPWQVQYKMGQNIHVQNFQTREALEIWMND